RVPLSARFGECQGCDSASGGDIGQECCDLLVGPEFQDGAGAKRAAGPYGGGQECAATFFENEGEIEPREAESSGFFGQGNPDPAEFFGHSTPDGGIENLVGFDPLSHLGTGGLFTQESARGADQLALLIIQVEVH